MKMKIKSKRVRKLNKIMASFVISAALLAEPFAGIPAVYAAEEQAGEQNGAVMDPAEKTDGSATAETGDQAGGSGEDVSDSAVDNGAGGENGKENGTKTDAAPGDGDDGTVKEDTGEGSGDPAEGNTGEGTDDPTEKEDGEGTGGSAETEDGEGTDGPEEGDIDEENGDPAAGENGEEADDPSAGEDGEESEDLTAEEEDLARETGEDEESDETDETEAGDSGERVENDAFSDMPAGYRLTSFQKELKADTADTLERLRESDEGVAFARRRVVTFAESREEAELIAEAYHAAIESFDMGVLTLKLGEGKTVRAAVAASADQKNNLPAVWPDYRRELYGETDLPTADVTSNLEVVEEEYPAEGETENTVPSVEAYAEAYAASEGVRDPYLNPASDHYQWFHTVIGSPYAWDAGYTGQSVTVGVIDSGVSPNPDLDANVIGRYDFCDGTADARDCIGHGTHVAGIIAALANGSEGTGVAPDARIYNARVFGEDPEKSGYDSTIMRAMLYLIGEENNSTGEAGSEAPRVDIINMSLGGSGDTAGFQAVVDKAYQKGVAVFAATGNDGGQAMMYPASYDHVVAVSATDKNSERAYFANYGSTTDLSAPGVNIWAAYVDGKGNPCYGSLQGTSMSCPVAAGQAAVILSGQADLPALQGKAGAGKAEALEAVMKANAVGVGAGMGKGITSLTQVFGLKAAAAKPNAPVIDFADHSDDAGQAVQVTITAQAGTKLCYTTNGKNPVCKNGMAGTGTILVEDSTVTFTLDGSQAARGTVKALAVSESGVVSPVKSGKYTLHPYIKSITVTGPGKVERGKSIRLSAVVAPSYAADKTVVWELRDAAGQEVDAAALKVDAKGKITAAAAAKPGIYTVIVRAKDKGGVSAACEIEVIETGRAVCSLAFDNGIGKELWITKEEPMPVLTLSSSLIAKEKDASGNPVQIAEEALEDRVTWTSSRPAVAAVDDRGVLTARSAGTVTITAKANDNGNKKASVKLTVKQGVTDIEIMTADGRKEPAPLTVASGRSIALKAAVSPAKPANKKVKWSVSPENTGVTIGVSTGKLSVKSGTPSGTYMVTATAADGKGASAVRQVQVFGGAIGAIGLETSSVTLYTTKVDESKSNTKTITATLTGADGATDFDPNAYAVTSSNEAIVRAEAQPDAGGRVRITFTAAGGRYGKAKVTVASTDGSNRKASCTVTVSGGIKSITLRDEAGNKAGSQTLFRTAGTGNAAPVSRTLRASVTGSEGADLTAYEVVSSDPALVSVSTDKATNEITLSAGGKSTGKAKITLRATDGSGKKASLNVAVVNPPSGLSIAPKAGKTRYVVPGGSVQLTAVFETEYGQITNKKVQWSLSDNAYGIGISVNSSGKVSAPPWMEGEKMDFTVYATAQDGSGLKASYVLCLRHPTTHLTMEDTEKEKKTYTLYVVYFTSDCTSPMACTSSSPRTASPSIVYTPYDPVKHTGGKGYIMFMPTRAGKATFTITALDSTDQKFRSDWVFTEREK